MANKKYKPSERASSLDQYIQVVGGLDANGNVQAIRVTAPASDASSTLRRARVTATASGNTTVIAAVSGKKFRVRHMALSSDAIVTVQLTDGNGGTVVAGPYYMATRDSHSEGNPDESMGIFASITANTALVVNLSATANVSVKVVYEEF